MANQEKSNIKLCKCLNLIEQNNKEICNSCIEIDKALGLKIKTSIPDPPKDRKLL